MHGQGSAYPGAAGYARAGHPGKEGRQRAPDLRGAGGAGYYFKVYRTKQVHEDYDEGGEYEEIPEEEYDDSPPWDEDGEADADEGGGDE